MSNEGLRAVGVGQAMKLLIEMMSKGCKPNVVTYNVLIKGICNEGSLCSGGKWMDAMKLLASMLRNGFSPNVVTFNTLINFLCLKGLLGKALNVLEMMPKHGCTPNFRSYNPLIEGFCNEKSADRTIEYSRIMVGKTVHVVVLFEEMCRKGLELDIITYSVIIDVQQGSEA
ncbi:Pentatricopeptide repeat-containing protein [Glycine soja]|nr:Pentatricopeptide repeat-containing protein [Glycine soja]